MLKNVFRNRKGQGLVEYALIVGGVAVTCALAITVFGLKTSEMIAGYAGLLPGANANSNDDITQTTLFELNNGDGSLKLDIGVIASEINTTRLNTSLDGAGGDLEVYVTNDNRVN